MPSPGFLEVNDFRMFPLIAEESLLLKPGCTALLPKKGITDAGFMLGIDSAFDVAVDTVTLFSVRRTGGQISFDFRCSASGMTLFRWLFTFPTTTSFGCTVQADATNIGSGTPNSDKGWGYMTVGDLSDLLALGNGTFELCTPARVEPALIQSLMKTYARSINLANQQRPCPTPCCSSLSPFDPNLVYVAQEGLIGDLLFKEGNNIQISVSDERKQIELSATLGAGEGQTCEDLLITADGSGGIQPDDGSLCESCDSYIRSINGVRTNDGKLLLTSAAGVKVISDKENNRLIVKVETDRICATT